MKQNNKKLKLFSLILLIIFCLYFQTVAYSAISSKLMITGDAVARIRNNVRINKFRIHEVSDGVISSYEEFSKTYTMSNVTLPNSDSYIIYELVIGNYEDVEMQLSSITGLPSNLTYELIDYNLHDMICDNTNKCFGGVEKTFYIKIKYANYNASGTNYNINLEYEFKEFSNTLMIGTSFRDTIPASATHLVFTDEKPANGSVLTDVSLNKDMGVVGYLDGTTYKVSTRRTGVMPEANADSSYMFNGKTLTNIDLDNLDISKTTNITSMFDACSSLTNINFGSDWDTSNITDMKYLFRNCSSLKTIDLSGFKTSKVTSFSNFFNGCSSLTSLDVSKIDTSNATSFSSMFQDCSLLEVIDVSGFNTSKVTNMSYMFKNCSAVSALDVSNFDLFSTYVISEMFNGCKKLAMLDIGSWDTSKVSQMYKVFGNCEALTSLDLSLWDVKKVANCAWLFYHCVNLRSLNLDNWNFINNESISGLFFDLLVLENLSVNNWNTSNITKMDSVFTNCWAIKTIDISSWDTSNVTNMSGMFKQTSSLKKIYVGSKWDTSKVVTSENMFYLNGNLTNFDSTVTDVTKAYVGEGGYLTSYIGEFTIGSDTYQFEDGMTFVEWAYSSYNTSDCYKLYNSLDSTNNFLADSGLSIKRNDVIVFCNDLINDGDVLNIVPGDY